MTGVGQFQIGGFGSVWGRCQWWRWWFGWFWDIPIVNRKSIPSIIRFVVVGFVMLDSATRAWVSTHASVSIFPFVHVGICDESCSVKGAGIGTKVRVLKSAG